MPPRASGSAAALPFACNGYRRALPDQLRAPRGNRQGRQAAARFRGTPAPKRLTSDTTRHAMPYFSVVIPTRNRPALLANAVASVLEQDFTDFELIVSDNSDPAQAGEACERLQDAFKDDRVHYLRPDRVLPMTEHWEWAVRKSRSLFTGILTDRSVYRLYALKSLHLQCERHRPEVVSFLTDSIFGEDAPFRIKLRRRAAGSRMINSGDMVLDFARCEFSKRAPRMLNSFCRTDRLHRIVERYGSVFTGYSPDYSFCFRILDCVDAVLSLDARLAMVGGESHSNGGAFRTNRMNPSSQDFLAQMKTQPDWFDYGPIPGQPGIVTNGILREYEIARSNQSSGRFCPIDKEAFYTKTAAQLAALAVQGFDQKELLAALDDYRRANGLQGSLQGHRRLKPRIRRWRDGLRDRFFRAATSIACKIRPAKPNRPLLRLGRWCTFDTVIAALRYDAQRAA